MTAHALIEETAAEGHKGMIVTAGSSGTGLAMAALARRCGVPTIFLVRSADAAAKMRSLGIEHVLVTSDECLESELGKLAVELGATVVFDGVGGDLNRA